jgi:capsule polysaccharide export protein KpsE/RkpR
MTTNTDTQPTNPYVEETLALNKSARAELPDALRALEQAKAERDDAQARVDGAEARIKALLRNVIKDHRKLGAIGLTTMADGSKVYWLPEDL